MAKKDEEIGYADALAELERILAELERAEAAWTLAQAAKSPFYGRRFAELGFDPAFIETLAEHTVGIGFIDIFAFGVLDHHIDAGFEAD